MYQLTNSQLAQQYMMNAYPCLPDWISLIGKVAPNTLKYDAISCSQLALISQAAMKTFDYIMTTDSNATIVRISRMLATLQDAAWKSWVSFNAQSKLATGTMSVTLTSTVLQAIVTFTNWDSALNPNPTAFNPPVLLDIILNGVTA